MRGEEEELAWIIHDFLLKTFSPFTRKPEALTLNPSPKGGEGL